MNDTTRRVEAVFREIFDDDTITLRENMTAEDVDGWTSLAHVNLIIAFENQLGIRFTTADISQTREPGQNVGTLLAMIDRKLNGHAP